MIDADEIIEAAIAAMLTGHQPLVDELGDAKYIEPDVTSHRDAAAYVNYHIISDTPVNTKQSPARVDVYRVQVDSFAQTKARASRLQRLVRQALENRPGTYAGVRIAQVKYEDYDGGFEPGSQNYRVSGDFMVRAENTIIS